MLLTMLFSYHRSIDKIIVEDMKINSKSVIEITSQESSHTNYSERDRERNLKDYEIKS